MSWILTYSGHRFDLLDPQPEQVDIRDIAHALAYLSRFTGHTRFPYSVAQHSLLVADLVPADHALEALMHDATEAYVNDLASPLKALLPEYQRIEARVWAAIAERFALPLELHPRVKRADLVALATERAQLLPPHPDAWAILAGIEPMPERIQPMPADEAEWAFLARYRGT